MIISVVWYHFTPMRLHNCASVHLLAYSLLLLLLFNLFWHFLYLHLASSLTIILPWESPWIIPLSLVWICITIWISMLPFNYYPLKTNHFRLINILSLSSLINLIIQLYLTQNAMIYSLFYSMNALKIMFLSLFRGVLWLSCHHEPISNIIGITNERWRSFQIILITTPPITFLFPFLIYFCP